MALLLDQFTTNASAPLTSPRTCEPGPGKLVITDTGNHLSIASSQLVANGGAASWGDPGWYGEDNSNAGFARGNYFEFDFTVTTFGNGALGWSNSTTLSLLNTKHAFFSLPSQAILLRDVLNNGTTDVQEYVSAHFANITYTVRIYAISGGGAFWMIKGGHFGGSFIPLGYSLKENDTTIYPALVNYNSAFKLDNCTVDSGTPATFNYCYYNGSLDNGGTYDIGGGVATNGVPIGRMLANPIVTHGGGGWKNVAVKEPWVLKDGSTWKMWYGGFEGAFWGIGYATSTDGITWTDYGSNPVLSRSEVYDTLGCHFPIVYKDTGAISSKRWRMLYSGIDGLGVTTISYAYSADGISWTKGAANPVVGLGTAGSYDDLDVGCGALEKSGSTYYLYYGAIHTNGPPQDFKICLATFTDFEGTYTKSANNPLLSPRTGSQALTANTMLGSTTVTVGNTAAFITDEDVFLVDNAGNVQENKIVSVDSGTQITLMNAAFVDFTTANSTKLNAAQQCVLARTVALEDGTWKMWLTAFEAGYTSTANPIPLTEHCSYATSSAGDSGWVYDHANSPALWMAVHGINLGWDGTSNENVMFARDADTYLRIGFTPTATGWGPLLGQRRNRLILAA